MESVFVPDLLQQLPQREREAIARLTAAFAERGAELHLVGGIVRDLLLGRGRYDLDFATSAVPELIKIAGAAANPDAVYAVGEAYGTIGFVFDATRDDEFDIVAEITTYRSEVYPTEDRHPVVTHGVSLRDDLARRDFTINALALDPRDGQLLDLFGGIADLQRRLIVAVGDAHERFNEDPLRVLRAARFAAQLDFTIAPETLAAMRAAGPQLARVSRERIAVELQLTADVRRRRARPGRAADGRPCALRPAGSTAAGRGRSRRRDGPSQGHLEHTVQVVAKTPPRLALRWAALLHDAAKPHDALGRRTRVRCISSGTSWPALKLAESARCGG